MFLMQPARLPGSALSIALARRWVFRTFVARDDISAPAGHVSGTGTKSSRFLLQSW
jgi:hypothetical protein